MHYYQWDIADYRKDADWLSATESGIYRWLIDQYYLDESAIKDDLRLLMRKMHLTSDQKEVLTTVLNEFFVLREGCWVHDRIEKEIERYKVKRKQQSAAGTASALIRKRKRTSVKRPLKDRSTNEAPIYKSNNLLIHELKKNTKARAKPESVKAVQDYLDELGVTTFTGQKFFDYQDARGWILSNGKPMKDWKATVRTWKNREDENKQNDDNETEGFL